MTRSIIDQRRKARAENEKTKPLRVEPSEYKLVRVQDILSNPSDASDKIKVRGRIVDIRKMGKIVFGDLLDYQTKIQLLVSDDVNQLCEVFSSCIDTGDLIEAFGSVGKTQIGHITIFLEDFKLVAKSLNTFPQHLNDVKKRYSQRFLDFTVNASSRKIAEVISLVCKGSRVFLWEKGFEEYQTPIISTQYNGGAATPFVTDIRAIGKRGYLRVTSEIYLKQLIAAGFLSVFEIGSQFRNEGLDHLHLPEFLMLEIYQAYSDANTMLELILELFEYLSILINGKAVFYAEDETVPCGKQDWVRVNAHNTIMKLSGVDILDSIDTLRTQSLSIGVDCAEDSVYATLVAKLVDKFVRQKAVNPTIVTGLPSGMTPLMKTSKSDARFADRYWLFAGEIDFCDIGSEQTNYTNQLEALKKQHEQLRRTHPHALINEDIVKVVAFGLPPTGGVGLSLSRLAMVLANIRDIKETPIFPLY
ncbi:MAG TPA: amino acid--tRNA ligase-related protein [Candidatus Wunengus sp. YC63]|uniref:amino acid--tRNA ligase-related protein n=1 Tax=Candidatus Wunengus sp. YC63 TaxID=3367699 RepID=UPI0027128D7E|nr:amino acid--tRNA ligase-related protein [Candidatus Brocadiales bacterium]